jgi:hypothetical protein
MKHCNTVALVCGVACVMYWALVGYFVHSVAKATPFPPPNEVVFETTLFSGDIAVWITEIRLRSNVQVELF